MARIIEYSDGFLFEIDDEEGMERRVSRTDGLPEKVNQTFQKALDEQVKPAARKVVEALRSVSPDQVQLEIGIKMKGEVGAVFAKGAADAHMVITMTWKAPDADS